MVIHGKIISMTIGGKRMDLAGWLPDRVSACTICGCAHRSPYDACNSCRAGQLAARQQLTVERVRSAGRALACAAYSAAACGALIKLGNLGPVVLPHTPREWGNGLVDVIADIERAREMFKGPPSFISFTTNFEHAVSERFGMSVAQLFAPAPAQSEPRPKRDRRNRGPKQHGRWWCRS